jgi:two-component system, OmpR family, heavy metal sensor histidine kinase CusS
VSSGAQPGPAPGSDVPSPAAPPSTPQPDVRSFVNDALVEFRRRNAVAIAWLRISLAAMLLGLFASLVRARGGSWYVTTMTVRAAFLAGAIAVLVGLWRRRAFPFVVAAGVVLDFASLVVGGWRVMHAPTGASAIGQGIMLAVAELVLLSGGLVLSEASLRIFALAICAAVGAWSLGGGFSWPFAVASAMTVTSFALAVLWAGRRFVRLAMEGSLQAYAAQLLRAHRDEVEATNRRLERSNREILEAQAQAEMLTQLIVHDLKNPLAAVLTNLGLVHEAVADHPELGTAVEDLGIARAEAQRLSGMIGDLLLVSRLERGELKGQLAPVRVADVLEAVGKAAGGRSSARDVRIAVDVPAGLVAWIDASLVRRLVENLVSNALRYTTSDGRIELSARLEGDRLLLAVRNTGTPVSPAARAQLFRKYATHGPLEPQNCGLGLYLCRLVAEAHHGRIALADRDGWNVSFEVELPMSPRGDPPDPPGREEGSGRPFDDRIASSRWRVQRDPFT